MRNLLFDSIYYYDMDIAAIMNVSLSYLSLFLLISGRLIFLELPFFI